MVDTDAEFLKQLRKAFLLEAEEHLQAITDGLQRLESLGGGDVEQSHVLIEKVFRETHTLKGAARAVDAASVEAICQTLEEAFASWKRRSAVPSSVAFDVLSRALGALRAATQAEADGTVGPATDPALLRDIRDVAAGDRGKTGLSPPSPPKTSPPSKPGFCTLPPALSNSVTIPSSVRIGVAGLEDLILRTEELVSIRQSMTRCLMELGQALEIQTGLLQSRRPDDAQGNEEAFKQLGELLESALQSGTGIEDRLVTTGGALNDSAKRFLLLPAASLLDQLPVLVRDLARSTGKEVRLNLSGQDVRLDRRILEDLKDILVHLLRNAVDHGLEGAKQRTDVGKAPSGQLSVLLAQNLTGTVTVVVEDDGGGIDFHALQDAAVAKGLLSRADASQLPPDEILQLMFHSEVSTCSTVTEVSGRGLGMAIVREKVTRLGGDIGVESGPGTGTRFTMTLPSMRSTFRGITACVGEQQFVIPSLHLARAMRINCDTDIRTIEGRERITVDGEVLPLFRLGELLGVRHSSTEPVSGSGNGSSSVPVLIVTSGGRRAALAVDGVGSEDEILPRPLGPLLSGVPHFEAATVTGGGKLGLVLNVNGILSAAFTGSGAGVAGVARATRSGLSDKRPRPPSLLVADDSITSRMLLKNVLEGSGFLVDTAVDGADAWIKLQGGTFDGVVSDVEMPRLNGFDLTVRIRADMRLAGLPVVLVTGLASPEDRARGADAGASAYIAKGGFDQSSLIDTLRNLL